jgi:hypothetical protein
MGTETSFKSFPAHVHNLLTITLAESHVVHTKIYPRYKTRQKIQVATEDFSRWYVPCPSQCPSIPIVNMPKAHTTRISQYGRHPPRAFHGWSCGYPTCTSPTVFY